MTDPTEELRLRFHAKAELRKRILSVRRALPKDAVQARSNALCERLTTLPEFSSPPRCVAGYIAMRGEADPAAAMRRLSADGVRLCLPRVEEDGEISLRYWSHDEALEASPLGFQQPVADAERVAPPELSLLIMPAVAVDERGHRIGLGKAFYDNLVRDYPGAVRVALVFDFQLVVEVPDTPGDERVHVIVTDRRILRQ